MSYNCRLYENTGFNAANIPYSLDVLNSVANEHHDVPALEIRQQRFLTSIRVKAHWIDVNECDYCVLYTGDSFSERDGVWCYFVVSVIMVAEDTAELSIAPDFITSVGIDNLVIVDGVVKRSTRALYNVNPTNLPSDPYLAPARPMSIVADWLAPSSSSNGFLASTLDIQKMGTPAGNDAILYTAGTETVPVPIPTGLTTDKYITYVLDGTSFEVPGLAVFSLGDYIDVRNGYAKARALGVEGSIIASWSVPSAYCSYSLLTGDRGTVTQIAGRSGTFTPTNVVRNLFSNSITVDGTTYTIPQRILDIINNSSYMPLVMTSVSGDSISADPKDIFGSFTIQYKADPRPEGKPYFRFEYLNTSTPDTGGKWFRNIISGIPWQNIPLVFTQASGSALNTAQFDASRNIANTASKISLNNNQLAYNNAMRANESSDLLARTDFQNSMIQSATQELSTNLQTWGGLQALQLNVGGSFAAGYERQTSEAIAGSTYGAHKLIKELNDFGASQSKDFGEVNILAAYNAQKLSDLVSYGIQQNIVTPTVMFPYNTDFLRDAHGNGVLLTRSKYDNADVVRIARIIKAFGVEFTQEAGKVHFTPESGQDFCYVDADVTIGDQPQWLANAIAAQISGGVRIWKTRPYHIGL